MEEQIFCNKCQTFKPSSEFYCYNDILTKPCEKCKKIAGAKWRKTDRGQKSYEERLKKDRDRTAIYKIQHQNEIADRRQKHREEYLKSEKRKQAVKHDNERPETKLRKKLWELSEKGRKVQKNNRDKYPNRRKARGKVNTEVQSERLPKVNTQECKCCNNIAIGYHHYLGYEREHWLDIIPLCRDCHIKADKELDRQS
jgi:hypothetical protein